MTESTFPGNLQPDPASTPPAARQQRRKGVVIAATVAAAALVAIAVAGLVFALSQPSALSRAADACAGTAPIDRVTAGEASDESDGEDADDMTTEEVEETFGEYFAGVVTLEDDGRTLIVTTKSADDDPIGVSSLALDCVQEELEMPTWLEESISTTRALDGRQDGDWDGFDAQWGYHPDNGLNLIIVQK